MTDSEKKEAESAEEAEMLKTEQEADEKTSEAEVEKKPKGKPRKVGSAEQKLNLRIDRMEAAVRFVAAQLSSEQYAAFAHSFPLIANKE